MIKYKRPSGTEIEVGDTQANRDTAKKLGWVEVKRTKAKTNGRNSKHSNS